MKFVLLAASIFCLAACETVNQQTPQDGCRNVYASGGKDQTWLDQCLRNPEPYLMEAARDLLEKAPSESLCLARHMNEYPALNSDISKVLKNRKVNCDPILRAGYARTFRSSDATLLCQAIYEGSNDDILIDSAKNEIKRRDLNCSDVLQVAALNNAAAAQQAQARASLIQSLEANRARSTNCIPNYVGGMNCMTY